MFLATCQHYIPFKLFWTLSRIAFFSGGGGNGSGEPKFSGAGQKTLYIFALLLYQLRNIKCFSRSQKKRIFFTRSFCNHLYFSWSNKTFYWWKKTLCFQDVFTLSILRYFLTRKKATHSTCSKNYFVQNDNNRRLPPPPQKKKKKKKTIKQNDHFWRG